MFRFANPEYLYLLAAVLLLAIVAVAAHLLSRKRIKRFGNPEMLARLVPDVSRMRPLVKFVLLELALSLLIVALARPQHGLREDKSKSKGIEVVIGMDVSNSMLAEDVRPNRLERSKLLVSTLIDRMKNDKVALQVFAGEAYPQLPITNDYVSAKMFLDALNVDMVTLQGTNLAAAIDLASISFTQNKKAGKAIVIITDGEDHEDGAIESAKKAAKQGMHVYVLGVGSAQGAQIPTQEGPLRDENGEPVVTTLNESMCREVAKAGNGAYIHIDNSNAAQDLLQRHLAQLQQAEDTIVYTSYDEQFRAFALLAFLLLGIEIVLSETKNPFFRKFKLFRK